MYEKLIKSILKNLKGIYKTLQRLEKISQNQKILTFRRKRVLLLYKKTIHPMNVVTQIFNSTYQRIARNRINQHDNWEDLFEKAYEKSLKILLYYDEPYNLVDSQKILNLMLTNQPENFTFVDVKTSCGRDGKGFNLFETCLGK
jgi:hypothetical protein